MCINQSVLVDQFLDKCTSSVWNFGGQIVDVSLAEKFLVARSEERHCIPGLAEANDV